MGARMLWVNSASRVMWARSLLLRSAGSYPGVGHERSNGEDGDRHELDRGESGLLAGGMAVKARLCGRRLGEKRAGRCLCLLFGVTILCLGGAGAGRECSSGYLPRQCDRLEDSRVVANPWDDFAQTS